MKHKLLDDLKKSSQGLVIFLVGFLIGTAIDTLFSWIYRKIDPKEDSNAKLLVLVLIQLFVIIFIVQIVSPLQFGSSFAFGLISSQIFFIYAVEDRFSGAIYDRSGKTSLCGYSSSSQAQKCTKGSCDPYECGPKDRPCFCMYRQDGDKKYYDCSTSVPPNCPAGSNCDYSC